MRRYQPGDTLIEVMFAFAVLATIASVSFSGALSAYKASISAQWRTESTFVAQYESDALLTYRKSLDWDAFIGNPAFEAVGGSPGTFCVTLPSGAVVNQNAALPSIYWIIVPNSDSTECKSLASNLLKNVNSPSIKVTVQKQSSANDPNKIDRALATVTVGWVNKNGQNESVKNLVLLTKEQQ